jgi:hypothetical protein
MSIRTKALDKPGNEILDKRNKTIPKNEIKK